MPKLGWWAAAFLLCLFWTAHGDDMVRGYWFAGWWRTVTHRPVGDWHLIDIVPFMAAYIAVQLASQLIVFYRELEIEQKSRGESGPEVK